MGTESTADCGAMTYTLEADADGKGTALSAEQKALVALDAAGGPLKITRAKLTEAA